MTCKEAVRLGILKGWTVKEAAFESGRAIHAIQNFCTKHKVVLAYGGRGVPPTKERIRNTKAFVRNSNPQTSNAQ